VVFLLPYPGLQVDTLLPVENILPGRYHWQQFKKRCPSQTAYPRECHVAGWGEVEGGKQSAVILSTTVRIMSGEYCNKLPPHRIYKRRVTGEYSFCSGLKEGGQDSCRGDSGGPLYCVSSIRGQNKNVLYGLVSNGPPRCGRAGHPGIYAKVSSIIPWIRNYTTGMLPKNDTTLDTLQIYKWM